jgi:hypothetical protein
MKSIQKVTRVKLNIDQNNDYILLGLVSSEPDYKLSLLLNKKFGISLRNATPLKMSEDHKTDLLFSRFSNNDDPADLILTLICNRSGKNFLLKKLKNIDYLLQIQTSEKNIDLNKLIPGLREIATVTAVFNLDLNKINDKNLQYLIQ